MSAKKHQKRKCLTHKDRYAHGSCKKCGKPLCQECALVASGVWYCSVGECIPPEVVKSLAQNSSAPVVRGGSFLSKGVLTQLLITVMLCLILLAVFTMREMWHLKAENSVLKESRLALIDLFREQNNEEAKNAAPLTNDTLAVDSFSSVTELPFVTEPVKKHPRKLAVRQYEHPPAIEHCVTNGPVGRQCVAITFDGGASANATTDILDTLASRSVKATMFLTGTYIKKFHTEVRRIVNEGHECGNHMANHPHLTTYETNQQQSTLPQINQTFIADQLQRAEVLFHSVTGVRFAPLWRAPYGDFNREICNWGYNAGYVHVGWRQGRTWLDGLDSNDWIPDSTVPGYRTPQEFLEKITKIASLPPPGLNGGIILMHLGTARKEPQMQTHRILGALIDTLQSKGFSIVPVSEMVTASGIDLASLRGRSDIQ